MGRFSDSGPLLTRSQAQEAALVAVQRLGELGRRGIWFVCSKRPRRRRLCDVLGPLR